MRWKAFLSLLLLASSGVVFAQPGTVRMTPSVDLGLKPQRLQVPEKFRGKIDTNLTVYLPDGLTARVYHVGSLSRPRFMAWGPDSVLYVADPGAQRIVALPDADHDGIADTMIVVATGVSASNLAFYDGAIYADAGNQITKYIDSNHDGIYESPTPFITGLASGGNHPLHTIVFAPDRGKVYVTTGSSCNVCREANRGLIEEYDLDGSGRRTYAAGTRNPVGLTRHPRTGQLWSTNNGSDNQGNDIPPEWIDIVRDGGFYGYPFVYADQVFFNYGAGAPSDYRALLPITETDSAVIRTMVQPAGLIQAHSAPLGMQFANGSFPERFARGAFVALHGSWNRYPATGHKVIYLDFDDDADTVANSVSDFITGFMTDSTSSPLRRWMRPAGLAVDHRGDLYISSDENNKVVLVVSPASTTDARPVPAGEDRSALLMQNSPNPFSGVTSIRFRLSRPEQVTLRIYDARGELVSTLVDGVCDVGEHTVPFEATGLPSGVYLYRLRTGAMEQQRSMVLFR